VSPLAGEMERLVRISYAQARKAVVLVIGSSILAIGIAMLILPGPAIILIPAGLALLAAEFAWARRWLLRVKREVAAVSDKLRNGNG